MANTFDGEVAAGTSAPVRVQDRPAPSPDRARLGKRVWPPMCSAANWSSEIALRKPGRPAPGHAGQEAGRGLVGEPRAHPRMRQPGDDREVVAEVLEDFQVGRELVVLAGLFREEIGRVQSQRRADADHPPPRLAAPADARAGEKASSQGKASATPAARKTWRRVNFIT